MRFVFVLLIIAFIHVSMAGFARPWENGTWISRNPNIWTFGYSYWWNLPQLQETLDSARLPEVSRLDVGRPADGRLSSAISSAEAAKNDVNSCTAAVFLSLGYFPSCPSLAFLEIFSNQSGCLGYRSDWISTVDSILYAVEESMDASDAEISSARQDFEKVVAAGLCDGNYSAQGSEDCAELRGAFAAIDSNSTEGDYGKYQLSRSYYGELEKELRSGSPDLSSAAIILGLVWGEDGTVQSFREVGNKSRTAIIEAEFAYSSVLKSASSRQQQVREAMKELEGDDYDKISRAPSGYASGELGTIRERYSGLLEEERQLERALSESTLMHSSKQTQGYLAQAVMSSESADQGYASLLSTLDALRNDAKRAVSEQEEEAQSELSATEDYFVGNAPGQESLGSYDEAKSSLDLANRASTLGDRYQLYAHAASLARAARNPGGYQDDLDRLGSVKYLESLITLAEKDNINTANEKESLTLIPKLPVSKQGDAAREAIESIQSKARMIFEQGLLEQRKRIRDKLSLAGPDAADLQTDLENLGKGKIDDDGLILPDALGKLKTLESDFTGLEEELDAYMESIVGNSMSTRTEPLITNVWLDEPAEITLDAVMVNPRPYNATNPVAIIKADYCPAFLYSDIVEGKEDVESVRMAENGKALAIVFSYVGPHETKRVVFSRNSIIAHTDSRQIYAAGLGGGKAGVYENISFSLDEGVLSMELPDDYRGGLIDGLPPARPLSAGKHSLSVTRIVDDAYNETHGDIKTYRIGTKSQVEYDIRIMPAMDIDCIPILIDSINSSHIYSFSVVPVTGETLKEKTRISETQYSARLCGLKAGKEAVLKVSYSANDTEAYVQEQLALLTNSNLGGEAAALLGEAKIQAAAGNGTAALSLIEKALAASSKGKKDEDALRSQADGLEKGVREELDELDSALSAGNMSSEFLQTLAARRTELQRVLAEGGAMNISERKALLENVDRKWLDKELTAFKKEAYTCYNDLKERFYKAGNASAPAEFLHFEEEFRRLESGGRLEYAVNAMSALRDAEEVVSAQEASSSSVQRNQKNSLEDMKTEVREILDHYASQASAAKGTDYSSYFTESEKKVETLIKDAEDATDGEPHEFGTRLDNLNRSRVRMEQILSVLQNESQARLSMLQSIYGSGGSSSEQRADFESGIGPIRTMISSGDYVNALRAESALLKKLDSAEGPDANGMLVLGLTALAALAAVAIYVSRQAKGKKELKRLTSFSAPAQPRHQPDGQGLKGRSTRSSPSPGHPPYSRPADSTPEAPSA